MGQENRSTSEKLRLLEQYYEQLRQLKGRLSPSELKTMTEALEAAILQEKQKEEAVLRARLQRETKKQREAEERRLERERKQQKKKEDREAHKQHVKSVTCMDLPLDFENAYAEDETVCVCVSSVADGLLRSLDRFGGVDIEYISSITGKSLREVIVALRGSIYQNPATWGECFYRGWETADEYLTGNLFAKLTEAKAANREYLGYFRRNVEALKALVPPAIAAKDIYITLGSPWVPTTVIDDFILYLAGLSPSERLAKEFAEEKYRVRHDEYTGIWEIPEKTRFRRGAHHGRFEELSYAVYGTDRMPMLYLLESTLNQRTVQVTDGVETGKRDITGKRKKQRVVNQEETVKAMEKQQQLVDAFTRWAFEDTDRATLLQSAYFQKFGMLRRRIFSGDFLEFPGMSDDIRLYDYQKNAVARILLTKNTLLAHDVGAGKTYVMIAAGMELRRTGRSRKNMYVVPNNILGQWTATFRTMYPGAKLLVVDEGNFRPARRFETLRRIKEEDTDAILIAYSSFDMLPLSEQYYAQMYRRHLELLEGAKESFASAAKVEIKQKKIRRLLEKLLSEVPKTPWPLPFDELGINTLFLDEAHYYKNVPIESEITRVHGMNKNGSDKCRSMMDKVHCIQRQNGGGRIVFATGTPVTNSLTDLFVLQKYLQGGELEFAGLHNFDNWVGMFAEKTTEYEIDVDTNSYHLKTRFARFKNVPELTALLASVADFHHEDTAAELPRFEGYTDSVGEGSPLFRDYLKHISERADAVRTRQVDRKSDNMLKITTDGRKAALDMRLIDPLFPCDAHAKVVRCAKTVAQIYYRTRDVRGVQLVFCDTSTPKEGFNLYDELKGLLVQLGIPSEQIAFIHDAGADGAREALFSSLRQGEKSVIIGSTFKTGHGVNIQERMVAMHHLDVPWRPADMVQREGRILRRGNTSESVQIYRYITKGSFDAYSWQLLEGKQRFISQILSGECTGRECSDVDETVLNYAEVKALAVGNPKIKRRVEVANELSKFRILERDAKEKRLRQRTELEAIPDRIRRVKEKIALCEEDIAEVDVMLRAEQEEEAGRAQAKAARREALDEKNKAAARVREAERAYKQADRAAAKAEQQADRLQDTVEGEQKRAEALALRAEAEALRADHLLLYEALGEAKDCLLGARELVAEGTEDGSAQKELRHQIYTGIYASINLPEDKTVAEYRGFRVVVPAYMTPHAVKERGEDGQLVDSGRVEAYVCLVRHGRYYVDVAEEFGILMRFNNVIEDLRGQRDKLRSAIKTFQVRKKALEEEMARGNDYTEQIQRLEEELDRLDEELGLKEAS